MVSQPGKLTPHAVLGEMLKNEVTHVVCLPDSETNWLYMLMEKEPSLDLVRVAREGQAISTASGISVGGKKPVVLIQNTGLMESGDSLRGWGMGLNRPLVLIVGYRGWTRKGVTPDTAAVYTERFLNAFNIDYYLVESDDDVSRISLAFDDAKKKNQPVAVLIGVEYEG